jgi:GNAT superfamily N-acetyltransferase
MVIIDQATTPHQIAAEQELMREYLQWVFDTYFGAEAAPTFKEWEAELKSLPGVYAPPMGRLLLATVDDQPAGCVALLQKDDQRGELKRMFVRRAFRGQRIGWQLGQKLLEEARTIGYKKVYLDSNRKMTSAHKIYEELGFQYIAAPDGFPQEMIQFAVFMECEL